MDKYYKYDSILVLLFMAMMKIIYGQFPGMSRDYCMETFKPTCNAKEMIIMTHAVYGRMKIGRCMKNNYGPSSCYADELEILDKLCSGKWNCELFIPNPELNAKQPCLEDMAPYLEASYSCQRVYVPQMSKCMAPERISTKKKANFLASLVSKDTTCGLHETPWILEALPGQQISLNLIDFAWKNTTLHAQNNKCDKKYGYILDLQTDDVINICGGGDRETKLYVSEGNSVQIILEQATVQLHSFFIKYQALGCPSYTPPRLAWSREENGSLVIGCEHSSQTWKLKCMDNIWLGIVGNCTPPPAPVVETVREVKTASSKSKPSDSLPAISNNHVVAFALGCITLLVCCSIVIMGIFCTKRYEARIMKIKSKTVSSHPLFQDDMMATGRTMMTYRPVTRMSLPPGTMELPPYTSPQPKAERPPKIPLRNPSVKDSMVTSTHSDYLEPQNGEDNSVMYYILENPTEGGIGNMSEEMYQSIHLHNSLNSKT